MPGINLSHILIFNFFPVGIISENCCDAIFGDSIEVEWPSTSTKTISFPPCVNTNKEFVYRECLNGTWAPEPDCFYLQKEKIPRCPQGYTEIGNVCYTYSNASSFPPKCPSEDIIPFDSYQYIIYNNSTTPIWMPIKRDSDNGIGFMKWIEPSSKYKKTYSDYLPESLAKNHDCVVYYNRTLTKAAPCNETHPRVCAYYTDQWSTNQECKGSCVQSDFFGKTKCTCLGETSTNLAEFHKIEQNNIIAALTNKDCSFGLEKLNGTYVWSGSGTKIDYTFWSKDVIFDENHIYGAVTTDGWILTTSPLTCSLYEEEIKQVDPSLDLCLSENTFYIYVTNPIELKKIEDEYVFCFTNADPVELDRRVSLKRHSYDDDPFFVEYTFSVISQAPGHYWCEAFRLRDMEVIRSNVVFFENPDTYFELVGRFQYNFASEGESLLVMEKLILRIQQLYFSVFEDPTLQNNFTNRVMKIEDFTDDNWIILNIHFTVDKTAFLQEEDAREYLVVHINDIYNGTNDAKLIDIVSTNSCFAEYDGKLNWPKTAITKGAIPKEFCFDEDGKRVSRGCNGNFVDGARWSSYDNCEIYSTSNSSYKLQDLIDNPSEENDERVYEITKEYQTFKALDVNLVAEIYTLQSDIFGPNPKTAAKTINNLVKIDRKILQESKKMKATNKLLKTWQNIIINCTKTYDLIAFDNLAFISVENIKGIIVFQNGSLSKITKKITLEELLNAKNLKSAIFLNANLIQSLHKIGISFFADDAFFDNPEHEKTSVIFGLWTSPFVSLPVKVLHKIENIYNEAESCVIWDGNSWKKSGSKHVSQFVICEYHQNGYFAFTYTPNTANNVTDALLSTLYSKDSGEVMLQKLSHISMRYHQFHWNDIIYLTQILEQIAYQETVSLENLAITISNLLNMRKDILIESQIKAKATDTILACVDDIIRKNSSPVEINTENFMILTGGSFSGVAILDDRHTFNAKVINTTTSIADVISYNNFDSLLYFEEKLINQLHRSKIIITVFNNDGLFNERSPRRSDISKIFGVILPDVGTYSGPITIINKKNSDASHYVQCVHWNYSKSSNNLGFWKNDDEAEKKHNLLECNFWHTTHFALLILARDSLDHSDTQNKILSIMSILSCTLSLICLSCIILTSILFKKWRQNTGNQILLNVTFIMIMKIVLFYVSGNIDNHTVCTIIGIVLHYATISQFCWMLVVAVLQYRRFVIVLTASPSHVLLKSCLCGWVFPLIPVVTVFFYDPNTYVHSEEKLCYPSDWSLYLGVWLPITTIITINSIIFVIIVCNVTCKRINLKDNDSSDIIYQWRLGILLFFMFGLTWVFALIANFHFKGSVTFLYIFNFTGAMEGVIIFIFFIVCNSNTRNMYRRAVKKCILSQNK